MTVTAASPSTAATEIGSTARTSTSASSSTDGADAGHQVAAVQPHRDIGRSVGQPVIEPRAGVSRGAQCGIVRRQPLAVAEHTARDGERAHGHHRNGQVEHRRHLPRPGDQPRRDPGQRQRAAQRQHAQRDRQQQPRQPRAQQADGGQQRISCGTRRSASAAYVHDPIADRQHRFAMPDDDAPSPRRAPASTMAFSTRDSSGRRPDARSVRRAAAPAPTSPARGPVRAVAVGPATGRPRRGR